MAKLPNATEEVDEFLHKLKHPLKEEIEKLRAIILSSNRQISEHIKWNAPSFCYKGEDRVTFHLHAKDRIQLIFHRGAKVKDSKDFTFRDSTGLLQWLAHDRAVVKLYNMNEVVAKKVALAKVVDQWMKSTSK